ncbi:unnamed protein product [Cunninghamella blakesleeana]
MFSLVREELNYTPAYCEENIYFLCKAIKEKYPDCLDDCSVIVISNQKEEIPMWRQRSGQIINEGLVVWDYHVVLLVKDTQKEDENKNDYYIYDFDTMLPFPTLFQDYIEESFRPDFPILDTYKRCFRKVPAKAYLTYFASDRSHMIHKGYYRAPPPKYPAIRASNYMTMTLPNYRDMTNSTEPEKYGHVLNENSFFNLT